MAKFIRTGTFDNGILLSSPSPTTSTVAPPEASLPAAGEAGSLCLLTTGNQGVSVDNGSNQWDISGGVFNVQAFGADPTGTANSTTAFSNAIAAIPAGAVLSIPPGTYKLTSGVFNLDGTKPIIFQGAGWHVPAALAFGNAGWTTQTTGTVLLFSDTAGDAFTINGEPALNIIFRDLALIGPGSGTTNGIIFSGSSADRCALENVFLGNWNVGLNILNFLDGKLDFNAWGCNTGMLVQAGGAFTETRLPYVAMQTCTTGINLQNGSNIIVEKGLLQTNGTGLSIAPSVFSTTSLQFRGVWFENNSTAYVSIDTTSEPISVLSFDSCHFGSTGNPNFVFAGSNTINLLSLVNCDFPSATFTPPSNVGNFISVNSRYSAFSLPTGTPALAAGQAVCGNIGFLNGLSGANFANIVQVASNALILGGPSVSTGKQQIYLSGTGPGIQMQTGVTATVNQVQLTSNVATLRMTAAANFQVGQSVVVSALTNSQFNGTFTITAVTTTTISYALVGANVGATADSGTAAVAASGKFLNFLKNDGSTLLFGVDSLGNATFAVGAGPAWGSAWTITQSGSNLVLKDATNNRNQISLTAGVAGSEITTIADAVVVKAGSATQAQSVMDLQDSSAAHLFRVNAGSSPQIQFGSTPKFGAFGVTAVSQQSITGALSTVADAAAKAVLTSIITALANLGWATNNTT